MMHTSACLKTNNIKLIYNNRLKIIKTIPKLKFPNKISLYLTISIYPNKINTSHNHNHNIPIIHIPKEAENTGEVTAVDGGGDTIIILIGSLPLHKLVDFNNNPKNLNSNLLSILMEALEEVSVVIQHDLSNINKSRTAHLNLVVGGESIRVVVMERKDNGRESVEDKGTKGEDKSAVDLDLTHPLVLPRLPPETVNLVLIQIK
jgi:hypothetical protein